MSAGGRPRAGAGRRGRGALSGPGLRVGRGGGVAGWGGGAARPEVRRFVRPAWGGAKVGLAARGRLAARRGGRPIGPRGTKPGCAFSRGADRASGGPREAELGADPRSGRCGVGGQEREGGAAAQVAGERWRLHKNVLWSLHKNVLWA